MAGRQSTSRAELSVVRLRIEGGAQADLGRVRLLGDVLAILEDADQVVADHDRRLKVRGGLPARHHRCQRQRGGEQQAGWTGNERPNASLDHAPFRGKRPASGAAGVGRENSRESSLGPWPGCQPDDPPSSIPDLLVTSRRCHVASPLHFRNFLKSTGRFSTNAFRPSIASSVR